MAKTYSFLVFCLLALALVRFVQGACTNSTYHFLGMKKLSKNDKQKLLDLHNQFREITAAGNAPAPKGEDGKERNQPPAANMLELTWDKDAAKKAYKLASTCEWKHDYFIDKDGKKMGQNVARRKSFTNSDVDKTFDTWTDGLVKGWFDEAKHYNYGGSNNMTIGHYTQLVWANTMKVGCGYSYFWYFDEKKNKKRYVAHLVCNYKPGGNVNNGEPYEESQETCTNSKLEPSKKYPHLCFKK